MYWIVIKYAGLKSEYEAQVEKCKSSPIWYSLYANYHLKFLFDDLQKEGKLKQGKKNIDGWEYEGQIDESGLACGYGKAIQVTEGYDYTYEGMWVEDKWEGIGDWR